MTWTFSNSPGTSTAAERRDAVRLLVGDTDTNDQQIDDEAITFNLSQAGNRVYGAAALTARMIASLYARRVDTDFEGVSTSYSQRQKHYQELAQRYEREDKLRGGALGTPIVGGVSIDEVNSVEDDSDRVEPAFKRDSFRNPPEDTDTREDYLG